MSFRTIIIDDERLARNELKKLLQEFAEIEVIDEAANVDEGLEKIEQHNPDLIFLDIQMPGKTGFDLLEELHRAPKVVFTTAYDEFMNEHGYKADVKLLGIPDRIVEHGSPKELHRECGYDAQAIAETVRDLLGEKIRISTLIAG